jgi:L-2-hydroxyglutarate oxidase LhgO
MSPESDVVVIGAGVIGLACAAALARDGRSVVVLERHGALAQETSARNSEVIHAGIYYPTGSLKAELCVAGRDALYARCARFGIPHRRTGKLIVATSQREVAALEALRERGTANGAPGLELIDAAEVRRREPCVRAVAALASPASGIVDAHALSLSFAAEAEAAGALFAYRTEVVAIERVAGTYQVRARSDAGQLESLPCAAVVNAGGLESDRIARLAGLDVDARGYRLHFCKGDYFSLAPAAAVRVERLVYPVRVSGFTPASISAGGSASGPTPSMSSAFATTWIPPRPTPSLPRCAVICRTSTRAGWLPTSRESARGARVRERTSAIS